MYMGPFDLLNIKSNSHIHTIRTSMRHFSCVCVCSPKSGICEINIQLMHDDYTWFSCCWYLRNELRDSIDRRRSAPVRLKNFRRSFSKNYSTKVSSSLFLLLLLLVSIFYDLFVSKYLPIGSSWSCIFIICIFIFRQRQANILYIS